VKPRLVIFFDLDGVLVDLNPHPDPLEMKQLRDGIFRLAERGGIVIYSRSIFDMYRRVLESPKCGFRHTVAKLIRSDLDDYEVKWARNRSLTRCGVQCLEGISRRGYVLAIVTNNGNACLRALFSAKKLRADWFDFTVTRNDCSLIKPSFVPLEHAFRLAQQQVPDLTRAWFIGDSATDRQASRAFNRNSDLELTFVSAKSFECLDEFFFDRCFM